MRTEGATRHVRLKGGKEEGAVFSKQEPAFPKEDEGPHVAV